jgi:hypothetical protein
LEPFGESLLIWAIGGDGGETLVDVENFPGLLITEYGNFKKIRDVLAIGQKLLKMAKMALVLYRVLISC